MAHSDNRKAEALAALDANAGNVAKTARQLGIPRKTLGEWAQNRHCNADVAEIRQHVKEALADRMESLLGTIVDAMIAKADDAKFSELSFGVEKITTSMQLLRGEATQIHEAKPASKPNERLSTIIEQLGGDKREDVAAGVRTE